MTSCAAGTATGGARLYTGDAWTARTGAAKAAEDAVGGAVGEGFRVSGCFARCFCARFVAGWRDARPLSLFTPQASTALAGRGQTWHRPRWKRGERVCGCVVIDGEYVGLSSRNTTRLEPIPFQPASQRSRPTATKDTALPHLPPPLCLHQQTGPISPVSV